MINMKYPEDYINKIIQGDCLEIMKDMPDESIDCIITSPPYNKHSANRKCSDTDTWKRANIDYGDFKDNLEPKEYIKQQTQVLKEATKIIKSDGSIFYNTKAVIANHRLIYPTFVFEFNVRQQII